MLRTGVGTARILTSTAPDPTRDARVAAEVVMRNAVLVVNPCAGRGSGARLAPEVVRELRRLGVDAEMRLTARPRHAI